MEMKPEIIVFAGPNGSGKSTVTKTAKIITPYINADDIKRATQCTDLEAAELAEDMREYVLEQKKSFTFETVMSTDRNIRFLGRAREQGYFVRCIYVLTSDVNINIHRVKRRFVSGGHDVPVEKIRSRYTRALGLIPELLKVCDICHIYDNTDIPYRIFKKRKDEIFVWENDFWTREQILGLTGYPDISTPAVTDGESRKEETL